MIDLENGKKRVIIFAAAERGAEGMADDAFHAFIKGVNDTGWDLLDVVRDRKSVV